MKTILVGVNHLKNLGGSELYTYTLVTSLLDLGYKVDLVTFEKGVVSQKIEIFNNKCTIVDILHIRKNRYDFAIISHNSLFSLPIKATRVIQICHGVYPFLEQPTYLADYHIAISSEVSRHLNLLGFENEIIYNPVDLNRFYPRNKISKKLKNVLSLCQGEKANDLLKQVCKIKGLQLKCFNKFGNAVWNIEDAINEADLVVSLGRGVMESMACGRSVLVFDHRSYSEAYSDGLINSNNIHESQKNNFSGRKYKYEPTKEFIISELDRYNWSQGELNLEYAKRNFDSLEIVKQILLLLSKIRSKKKIKKKCINTFQFYENKILINDDSCAYFIKLNQKCLISSFREIPKIMKIFNLQSILIFKNTKALNLDLLPSVSFIRLRQLSNNIRAFNATHK